LNSFGLSVWHEFSPLALKHGAVNLGQGFPSWTPPDCEFLECRSNIAVVLTAYEQAARAQTPNINPVTKGIINQYARSPGHLRLVQQLAKLYSPLVNKELNPLTNFVVTNGASGGESKS
jgi:kynurenine--oxoglutarate transaminase/cysteine-S-conjugate beta-lyase/glutamine--phenylpyruvate transaminase